MKKRYLWHDRLISLLSCFAGGVFMATGLLDLLPQVVSAFVEVKERLQLESQFPVAEFSVGMGFFLVLLLEQLVLDCQEGARASAEQRRLLRRDEEGAEERREPPPHPSLRSLLLVAALSLHSLFEGLAVGLQQSPASLLQIAAAVGLHKAVVAFSLGMSLARSRFRAALAAWSALVFSAASPLGIGAGLGVSRLGRGTPTVVTTAVLEGLACGTFVYVTFFEVLPHELQSGVDRKAKLLAVVVGFGVVCGLLFLDL
ncbi:zinc transporter ZIP1-like isoform X2 [Bacillus rossius redtenbacheri]|uniref:zinc transporter ZIP1-like isoform X2 n=1 Tax=Bacillus rossius redtenbacheri TaxID=93214 RepID=UPI002FDF0844